MTAPPPFGPTVWKTARRRRPIVRGRARRVVIAASVVALAAAFIALAGGSSSASTGFVNVGVVAPFSGASAVVGPLFDAPCQGAARVINQAGGVLGQTMKCSTIDDTGDPADAVPNVSKAVATLPNLDLAIGLETDTSAVTVPIISRAKIPLFTFSGLAAFDNSTDPYFWRPSVTDTEQGAAFGIWAATHNEKRVALVFPNSPASQVVVPGIKMALARLHGTVVANDAIPADASSYASVVASIIRQKPQAILTDSDIQTQSTFFSQYSQLNHGSVPPLIVGADILFPQYFSAISKALGATFVATKMSFIGFNVTGNPQARSQYVSALRAAVGAKQTTTVLGFPAIPALYDSVIIAALAMDLSKSTRGSVYNSAIERVTNPSSGAVVVHTYAAGLAALKAGKQIDYVGAAGQFQWNKHHTTPIEFQALGFTHSGSTHTLGQISTSAVAKALS